MASTPTSDSVPLSNRVKREVTAIASSPFACSVSHRKFVPIDKREKQENEIRSLMMWRQKQQQQQQQEVKQMSLGTTRRPAQVSFLSRLNGRCHNVGKASGKSALLKTNFRFTPMAFETVLTLATLALLVLLTEWPGQISGQPPQEPSWPVSVASFQQQLKSRMGSGAKQFVQITNGFGAKQQQQQAQVQQAAQTARQQAQNNPDAPKLIPLSALDRYQEGSDLRLFCSASAPPSGGRLMFEWRKDQSELLPAGPSDALDSSNPAVSMMSMTPALSGNNQLIMQSKQHQHQHQPRRVQISSMDDEGASLLRITRLEADDSGNYSCLVRNQHGFDSSTVRVHVNVKLKWTVEPPGELQVKAGKFVQLECDASGQPAPLISWTSLKDHQIINSKVLRIDRVTTNHSGLYECRAISSGVGGGGSPGSNQFESSSPSASHELLRKLVRLIVNDLLVTLPQVHSDFGSG